MITHFAYRLVLICLILMTSIFAKPFTEPMPSSHKKLMVVATFSILGDMIRRIGGEWVDVCVIVPENTDPHVYQSTPKDAEKISKADLVIRNGLGFEGWFDRLIDNSGYKGPHVAAAKNVKARPLPPTGTTSGSLFFSKNEPVTDPHAWHCVQNAILYVETIADALITALPDRKKEIQQNKEIYRAELEALDSWVRDAFKNIPPTQRYVITTHDAFWYYGESYGVHFLSPIGISTDAEPAAAAIAQLLRDIKEKHIRAIFIENLSSRKLIEEIAREARVTIGGVLYADSLSDPTQSPSPARTYVEMIRHNTQEIVRTLG